MDSPRGQVPHSGCQGQRQAPSTDAVDNIFAVAAKWRASGAGRLQLAANDEELNSGDDLPSQDFLSPLESVAKSEIWHEVNRDVLEYCDLQARKKKEKELKAEEARKRQQRDEVAKQDLGNTRAWREKKRSRAPNSGSEVVENEILEDTVMLNFWGEHAMQSMRTQFHPSTSVEEWMEIDRRAEVASLVQLAEEEDRIGRIQSERRRAVASGIDELFS